MGFMKKVVISFEPLLSYEGLRWNDAWYELNGNNMIAATRKDQPNKRFLLARNSIISCDKRHARASIWAIWKEMEVREWRSKQVIFLGDPIFGFLKITYPLVSYIVSKEKTSCKEEAAALGKDQHETRIILQVIRDKERKTSKRELFLDRWTFLA